MATSKFARAGLILFVLTYLSTSEGANAETAAGSLGVRVARVPDSGLYPQVQTDRRGRVHLIYFKGDPRHGDIFYVRSDDGLTFTDPLRVNTQPQSALIIGTIRGPHVAVGKNDRVHVAWMGSDQAEPKSDGKAPMLYTRLADGGKTFEPQRNVIDTHSGLDGGGSVGADQEGNVYVAWHAPDAGDGEANRRVWLTRSHDEGKTFSPEMAAIPENTGVCGCCGMNILASDKGTVLVAFRSATAMVNRDVHLLLSNDCGKTFHIVEVDPWRVGMCVMSTASIATTEQGFISAWETKEQIRVGKVNLQTGKAGEPVSVPGPAKSRKYPSVAVDAHGNVLVAWAEGTGWNRGGAVAWQVFDATGWPVEGTAGRVDGLAAWSVPAAFVDRNDRFTVAY